MSNSPLELLQIADLAKQWPPLKPIHDVAMAQLEDMVGDAKDELNARAEKKAKAEADARAKAAAEAKVRAEKDAPAPRSTPAATLADRRPA